MKELSTLSGLAGSHAGLIARGAVENPRIDVAEKLAHTLGVSLDWLVRGEGEPPTAEAVRAAVEAAREADRALKAVA